MVIPLFEFAWKVSAKVTIMNFARFDAVNCMELSLIIYTTGRTFCIRDGPLLYRAHVPITMEIDQLIGNFGLLITTVPGGCDEFPQHSIFFGDCMRP